MAGRARDEGGKAVETLKVVRKTFTMLSENHTQVLDITKQIRDIMLSADVKEGILLVNSLHTTCALFVNEFQGALVEDLKTMLDRLVPDDGAGYKHDDPRYSDCERGEASPSASAAESCRWGDSSRSCSPSWTGPGRGASTSRSWACSASGRGPSVPSRTLFSTGT